MRMERTSVRPCGYCCSASSAAWADAGIPLDRILLGMEPGSGSPCGVERGVREQGAVDDHDAWRGMESKGNSRTPVSNDLAIEVTGAFDSGKWYCIKLHKTMYATDIP